MRVSSKSIDGDIQVFINGNPIARWSGDRIEASGELGACTALLPALMSDDPKLEIEGGITVALADNLETLQDVYCRWWQETSRVEVVAEQQTFMVGNRTVVFFSGGVDSFHAALKHRNEIEQLIYVEGFDIQHDKPNLRKQVRETLARTARSLEIPLTILRTDLRQWSDRKVDWPRYHGAALASAAHLLRGSIDRAIVPSSTTYDDLFPWGSHPLTDPLWTGAVELVHSGCEATRPEKIAAIAEEATARKALRVCWENPGEAYNCGVCEKCLRTMTTLAAFGILGGFEMFPNTLTAENVLRLQMHPATAKFAEENIELLGQQRVRADLQAAWGQALEGRSLRHRIQQKHQLPRRQLLRAKRYVSRRIAIRKWR